MVFFFRNLGCILVVNAILSESFDPNVSVRFGLPSVGDKTLINILNEDVNDNGEVPVLLPISSSNNLITLHRVESSDYVPVGRSYNNNDWESVAGPEVLLKYSCGNDNSTRLCEVHLPMKEG